MATRSPYNQIAQRWGVINPLEKSNLIHFDLRPHESQINDLVKRHGYEVKFVGGKYGDAPAGTGHRTGHLLVYDPTPTSGKDMGDEALNRTHRTIYALAHALTREPINQKYGEGKRVGRLGIELTPHEAKRAVEHVWAAGHKMKDLAKEAGYEIPKEAFAKEINTLMHDAVHRVLAGHHVDPSMAGFVPKAQKVSIKHAFGMIDDAAEGMGLGQHDRLSKMFPFLFGEEADNLLEKFEGVAPKAPTKPMTIQGRPIEPNAHITGATDSDFNPDTGELHTPKGTFKVQLHDQPHKLDLMGNTSKDYFNNIIERPDIQKVHEKAMSNWQHLNGLMAKGKIPDPLVAHSALFTVLSANNAVPMQELMYSRLVDQLKRHGVNPGSVSFGQLMGRGGKLREAWKQSDNPRDLPEHARKYFEGPMAGEIRQQAPSERTGRKKGDIYKLQYMDAASDKLHHYPELHGYLTDLVRQHGNNAQSAVSQMMKDKAAGTGPEALTAGAGVGSKIGRYMYSMMGGGNVHVPDTHLIRHLFGLDSQRDTESHKYLKDVLWDPRNHHILNKIDKHYLNNYPTVKYVQNKYFGGKPTDQALFPAFWLHWLAIAPHEKMLGIGKPQAAHNASDHTPYWDMANEILRRHGLDNPTEKAEPDDEEIPIHFRTASAMHELESKLGPAAASLMFYGHILPHLLKQ